MNSDLYHWQSEQMVRHEMHEIDRAVEQARLLREAGLSQPGWLTRVVNRLVHRLNAPRKRVQEQHSHESNGIAKKSPRSA